MKKEEIQSLLYEEQKKISGTEKLPKEELKVKIKDYFEQFGAPRSKIEAYEGLYEAMRRSGSIAPRYDIDRDVIQDCIRELYEDEDVSEMVRNYWENIEDE